MPCTSAVCATGSTSMTPSRPLTSSPWVWLAARGRKRLEVFFASRTGEPAGIASYDAWSRATAASCACHEEVTRRTLLPGRVREISGRSGGDRAPHRAARVAEEHRDAGAGEVAQGVEVGGGDL